VGYTCGKAFTLRRTMPIVRRLRREDCREIRRTRCAEIRAMHRRRCRRKTRFQAYPNHCVRTKVHGPCLSVFLRDSRSVPPEVLAERKRSTNAATRNIFPGNERCGSGMGQRRSARRWCKEASEVGMAPFPICQADFTLQRTDCGRAAASMRLTTATPIAASVRCAGHVRARSRVPMSVL
jgi:hypothetical protein